MSALPHAERPPGRNVVSSPPIMGGWRDVLSSMAATSHQMPSTPIGAKVGVSDCVSDCGCVVMC